MVIIPLFYFQPQAHPEMAVPEVSGGSGPSKHPS